MLFWPTFAFAEVHRHEGLSFNQRYLLELLPLAAVGFAWALDGLKVRAQPVLAGGIVGRPDRRADSARYTGSAVALRMSLWLAQIPRAVEASASPVRRRLASCGSLPDRGRVSGPCWAAAAGLCLGWGLTLHLADDVAASHRLRGRKLAETEALGRVLPDGSALVAYTGYKDAAVPLLFDRDIVILDARARRGEGCARSDWELLARDRRVFLLQDGFPGEILSDVRAGWQVVRVPNPGTNIVELRALAIVTRIERGPGRRARQGRLKGHPPKECGPVDEIPLIGHSIEHGLAARPWMNRVIVSTEDEEIGEVSRRRPAPRCWWATRGAGRGRRAGPAVFEHALAFLEKQGATPDVFVHLRPTTPFRKPEWIDEAVDLLRANPTADAVRSVSPPAQHPWRMFKIGGGRLPPPHHAARAPHAVPTAAPGSAAGLLLQLRH